jgi:hypothetical protein
MRRTYGAPWLVATHAMHAPVSADAYTKGLSCHLLEQISLKCGVDHPIWALVGFLGWTIHPSDSPN